MRSKAGLCALALMSVVVVAGCGGSSLKEANVPKTALPTNVAVQFPDVAMTRPGAYTKRRAYSPDILIQGQTTLPAAVIAKAVKAKGVKATEQFSLATFYSEETPVTYAAVDPASFRSWTPGPTKLLDELWNRVADGEIALRPDLRTTLASSDNFIQLGNDDGALKAHVGAYAPLVDRSRIGALINERWAQKLGMPTGNALLVTTGSKAPADALKQLRKAFGKTVAVSLLAPNVDPNVAQQAVLTGGSISKAVGSFTYTANKDGTVNPDPKWVSAYIRTEQVPIIGSVTCNKGMLPQLRMALNAVVRSGLAKEIHPGEYGGCYVPRYIANDPSRGLSFHTFGTAIDLNVPGNERGTVGQMNRTVVSIFTACGFNWGGYWNYTDPMHFELARLVSRC